jgi:hypothetical protein
MPADVMAAFRMLNAQQKRERVALGPTWIDTGLIAINEDGSPIGTTGVRPSSSTGSQYDPDLQ